MRLHRRQFRAMGSPCELAIYAESPERGAHLLERSVAEIERLEAKYSRYRDDSVTSRINAHAALGRGIDVDPETASLLDYADTAYHNSGRRFDITSGALREVWDFRSGALPTPEAVEAVLQRVGWSRVRWRAPRLDFPTAGMQLDFGGYVKEYTADRVAQLCRDQGCRAGLVDLGGDLAVVGPHPDGSPWAVGIRDPRRAERALARVDVFAGGIATSGDYERCMVVDGVRYGHVLDPCTGWPVSGLSSVTVLASHCLIAGTASTVAMLSGPRGGAWLDDLGLPHVRVDGSGAVTRRLRPEAQRAGAGPRPRGAAAAARSAPAPLRARAPREL